MHWSGLVLDKSLKIDFKVNFIDLSKTVRVMQSRISTSTYVQRSCLAFLLNGRGLAAYIKAIQSMYVVKIPYQMLQIGNSDKFYI